MNEYSWAIASFSWFLYVGIVGVNISLHRYFSHNSFQTGKLRDWLLLISSFFPMLGSPAMWGSIHRFHHAHSDTKLDPHNPNLNGKLRSWFTAWPDTQMPLSIFRSLMKDERIAFLNRNYFSLVMLYAIVLTLIDWRLTVFIFAIPAVGCFHGAAAIAVIPHIEGLGGYRNHESRDDSRNNFLAWILSLGEGWHNNHHHTPQKFRHGEKWWELDPSAFLIKNFFLKKTAAAERRSE